MMTPRVSSLLFTAVATIALACGPSLAFAQHHGRGSRGGGGSHSGGSRGGGHSHFGGGGGFHLGSGGHNGGKSFARGRAVAPRQMSERSYKQFGGSARRTNSNFAFAGSRSFSSIGSRGIKGVAGQRSGAPFARPVAPGTHTAGMSFNSNRPPNATSTSRSWSGQGQSSWANAPGSLSSFNANRPPNATSSRSWLGQGQSASTPRSPSSYNSNRPPDATSASRNWPGRGPSSRASTARLPSSLDPNHALSNFGNSRFGNSAFGHSSRSNSRARSSVSRFAPSRFGNAHPFELGATSNAVPSFGGDEFSFVPGLFGLALDLGGFGLRGLSLLGSGLTDIGLQSLDLLGSGLGGFRPDASLESRPGATGSAFSPTENLTCNQ
jgi:hypothetical protein